MSLAPFIAQTAIDRIESEMAELAANIAAAQHRFISLIRDVEALDVALGTGLKSTAHWLSYRFSIAPGAAREKVRVARALGRLPHIDEAFRCGELSYSKVRALTRVATPETDARLSEMAKVATAAQLEKICRGAQHVRRELGQPVCTEDERWVVRRVTERGLVRIEAQLLPDEAEIVMKAIAGAKRAAAADRRTRVSAETSNGTGDVSAETSHPDVANVPVETPGRDPKTGEMRHPSFTNADALVRVCEAYCADNAKVRPGGARTEIIVHLGPDQLLGGHAAELEDGTRVSAETLRRLACDSGLVAMSVDEKGNALDVGRRTRAIPPAIMRALRRRDDAKCRFPGCEHHAWLDGHHVEHWLDGGETKLGNLMLLCSAHHRLIHEGGFTVERAGDGFVFRRPDGVEITENAPPMRASLDAIARLLKAHKRAGLLIDPETCRPKWNGEPVDFNACIEAAVDGGRHDGPVPFYAQEKVCLEEDEEGWVLEGAT